MTLLDVPPAASAASAGRVAAANWQANVCALAAAQPDISIPASRDATTFTFGRDGALTALDSDGSWHLSCSVPRAAAREMLKSLDARGQVACFLDPRHAAALRVALDKLLPEQAVIAAAPDVGILRTLLHCDDFSGEIRSGRLFFAAGAEWAGPLSRLLRDCEGLPTPALFIKTPLLPEAVAQELIATAQRVLSEEATRRAELIEHLRVAPRAGKPGRRVCVVAPSRFRLWDDAAEWLAWALPPESLAVSFDPDCPTGASPLALAKVLRGCDAILTANTARSDLSPVAADAMPWVTWVTSGRIPAPSPAATRDHLLLADPTWRPPAIAAGWPADRVHVANWPQHTAPATACASSHLALISDTAPVTPPPEEMELSSHTLLWEAIAEEVVANPLCAIDANAYLTARMRRLEVSDEGFDRNLFLSRLILPADQQGLAGLLVSAGVPLRLFGRGWSDVQGLAGHAAGAITSRDEFDAAVASAAALVHAWPTPCAHPVDAAGKPLLRPGPTRDGFLRAARAILRDPSPSPTPQQPLNTSLLARILF